MHHVEAPARPQKLRRLPRHIVQRTEHLMAGDRLGQIGIFKSMGIVHIGRIRGHHVKGSRAKQPAGFLYIALYDRDPLFQVIERHTARGHLRHLILNLQSRIMFAFIFRFQKNRDNSRPSSQIDRFFPRLHRRETG